MKITNLERQMWLLNMHIQMFECKLYRIKDDCFWVEKGNCTAVNILLDEYQNVCVLPYNFESYKFFH